MYSNPLESYGIYFHSSGASAQLTGNTVTNNNRSIRVPFSAVPDQADGNVLTPNTLNHVGLYGGTLSRVVTLPDDVPVYYLEGSGSIQAGASSNSPGAPAFTSITSELSPISTRISSPTTSLSTGFESRLKS